MSLRAGAWTTIHLNGIAQVMICILIVSNQQSRRRATAGNMRMTAVPVFDSNLVLTILVQVPNLFHYVYEKSVTPPRRPSW